MNVHEDRRAVDDESHVPMSGEEKIAWVYGVVVLVTSGTYFVWLATQLAAHPVEDIAWEIPLLITLGASIVLTIVGTILGAIGGAVWQGIWGRFEEPDFTTDERDRAIKELGNRRMFAGMTAGVIGTLALAMLDVDTLWIGNWVFLACSIGALAEVVSKIRAYRRGV